MDAIYVDGIKFEVIEDRIVLQRADRIGPQVSRVQKIRTTYPTGREKISAVLFWTDENGALVRIC